MSVTAPTVAAAPPAPATGARPSRALLACTAIACALVLGSGALRWWQARRVEAMLQLEKESPFPLDSLPMTLGDWVGEKTELDPQIVAGTGANDLITRRYVNRVTGVAVEVIVLHGPASDIFVHTPEWCYPRAGFAAAGEVMERSIPLGDAKAPFRSTAYTKGDPARPDTQEVIFSWRYNGRWTTTVNRPKEMERVAGMYKVQVARKLQANEARTVANPCEAFLELLVPVLEARIRGQSPPSQATPGPAVAPTAPRDPTPPEGTHR
jgi:hypothetical protein